MKRSSLLGHVVEVLDSIRSTSRPADTLVKEFFRQRRYLGARDRRFIAEFVYGVLRNYALVDAYVDAVVEAIDPHLSFPSIPSLARALAFAVRIRRDPADLLAEDAASLWESVKIPGSLHSFLAALSEASLPPSVQTDPVRLIALETSTPVPLVQEWVSRWGEDDARLLAESLTQQAPTTVRVNTLTADLDACKSSLEETGVNVQRTKHSPVGLVLGKRIAIEGLESYRKGFFEMQDEGSQLVTYLLELNPGMTVVDACAGGGGKTLHAAALMENKGTIFALDTDRRRLTNLTERASRAGVKIVRKRVVSGDDSPLNTLLGKVDAVLIDAPCSGVGTYRRNPGLKMAYSEDASAALARTQRSLLETYAPVVKPGGRLVYSTCTLVSAENEEVIQEFLQAHDEFTLLNASEILQKHGIDVKSASPFLLLLPHKTGTDGFFAAVMVRHAAGDAAVLHP